MRLKRLIQSREDSGYYKKQDFYREIQKKIKF